MALGRLGGLVGSEAKQRANRENGRKGGLVKSRKKRIAARRNAPIRLRFWAESNRPLGDRGIRYSEIDLR
jgi:hypothetical protein